MKTSGMIFLIAAGAGFLWPLSGWAAASKPAAEHPAPEKGANAAKPVDNDSTRGFIMEMNDNANVDLRAGMDRRYSLSPGLLLNRQRRPYHGLQLSLCFNHAAALWGGQIDLLGNSVRGPLDGFQFSAIGNLAGDSAHGIQMAPVMNIANGTLKGGQVTAGMNAARDVQGAQLAAILNTARDVDGCQIGLVNLSRDIRNGIPFGLVNYSHTGLHSLNLWTDESGFQHVGLLSGSRNFYTYLSAGGDWAASGRALALGAGMGGQIPLGPWFGAADLGVTAIRYDYDFQRNVPDFYGKAPELYKLTLTAGRKLVPYVSAYAGLSMNVFWDQNDGLSFPIGHYQNKWADDVYAWPGLSLGLRLGR